MTSPPRRSRAARQPRSSSQATGGATLDQVEPSSPWASRRRLVPLAILAALLFAVVVAAKFARSDGQLRAPIARIHLMAPNLLTPGEPIMARAVVLLGAAHEPAAGVDVDFVLAAPRDDAKPVELGTIATKADGSARLQAKLPADLARGRYQLSATLKHRRLEGRTTVGVAVGRSTRTHVSTDKPLYQPGQIVHIRSLTMDAAQARPLAGGDIALSVWDAEQNRVFHKSLRTSEHGIAAADFELADQLSLGSYVVSAEVAGELASQKIEVRRYQLPKFELELHADESYAVPRGVVRGQVQARYTFGQPVANEEVVVALTEPARRSPSSPMEVFTSARGRTDREGRFRFTLELTSAVPLESRRGVQSGRVRVAATVATVASGSREVERLLPVSSQPLRLHVVVEGETIVPAIDNVLFLVTTDLGGKPLPARVRIEPLDQVVHTGPLGVARVTLPATSPWRDVRFEAAADGDPDHPIVRRSSWMHDDRPGAFALRPERVVVRAGESLPLSIVSSEPGDGSVVVDLLADGRSVGSYELELHGGHGRAVLKLPAALAGTMVLSGHRIVEGDHVAAERVIHVVSDRRLDVSIEPAAASYGPGEEAILRFAVRDRAGEPAPAALGVSGVDEAVFALLSQRPEGIPSYFELRPERLAPRQLGVPLPLSIEAATSLDPARERTEGEELARSLVFAAAGGPSSSSHSASQSYDRTSSARARQQELEHRELLAAIILVPPATIFALWVLLLGIYAAKRLGPAARPAPQAGIEHGSELQQVTGKLSWGWFAAVYVPVVTWIGLGLALTGVRWSRFDRDLAIALCWLVPSLLMAGWLLRVARIVRRSPPTAALPWFRKAAAAAPVAQLLWTLPLLACFGLAEARWVDTDVLVALIATLLALAHLAIGLLAVARQGALRARSLRQRWWLGLSRLVPAGLPALFGLGALLTFATMNLGELKYSDEETARASADMWEGGTGARAKGEGGPMGDADVPVLHGQRPQVPLQQPGRLRRHFPETLLWQPLLVTDDQGRAELRLPLADSITTWRIAASAVSSRGSVGAATASLPVFQDFFVDLQVPARITRGDEISLRVALFNYLEEPQTVRLQLELGEGFEAIGEPTHATSLAAKQTGSVSFEIRAKRAGTHAVRLRALGTRLGDAVERRITVEPNGRRVVQSWSGPVGAGAEVELAIPDDAIEGASDLYVEVFPSVAADLQASADKLLTVPRGCFEQSVSSTYPNVFALQLMQSGGPPNPQAERQARRYVGLGYQRMLSYQVRGGGFDWYGEGPADLTLTAYGLLALHDIGAHWPVDERVVAKTRDWLLGRQRLDGHFGGHDDSDGAPGGRLRSLRSSAYVAWALSAAKTEDRRLNRALDVIARTATDDPYALALAANALIAARRSADARPLLERLVGLAKDGDDDPPWSSEVPGAFRSSGRSLAVTTTALATTALVRAGQHLPTAQRALRWLARNRDGRGTWHTTAATIASLRAMAAAAATQKNAEFPVVLDLRANGQSAGDLVISADGSDVVHLVSLRDFVQLGANTVSIVPRQPAPSLAQVLSVHHIPWREVPADSATDSPMSLTVSYDRTDVARGELVEGKVILSWHGKQSAEMPMVEVGVAPGLEVEIESLTELARRKAISGYALEGRGITFYLPQLTPGGSRSISFRLRARYAVRAQAPPSRAYPYYQPEAAASFGPVPFVVR